MTLRVCKCKSGRKTLTREDIEAGLSVLRRVSVGGVADDHARLPDGSVSDQHTADHPGLQLILPGQPASGGDSGLLVKVIHLRWHVEPRIKLLTANSVLSDTV